MKTRAITIITATLLGVTAALAQGPNAGAIPTNLGAIGTNPGAIPTNPIGTNLGAIPTNPGAIGSSSQSLQPLTGGQGLGYPTPVSPGVTGIGQSHRINLPVGHPVAWDRSPLLHRMLLVRHRAAASRADMRRNHSWRRAAYWYAEAWTA